MYNVFWMIRKTTLMLTQGQRQCEKTSSSRNNKHSKTLVVPYITFSCTIDVARRRREYEDILTTSDATHETGLQRSLTE